MRARFKDFFVTLGRLIRAELLKLSHYWVVVAGYFAIVTFALPGAVLAYHGEQALNITSESGYDFAISLMVRFLDLGTLILYVMICILFAIDVSNSTVKYILTRPVTRMELLLSKYVTALIMVALTVVILWSVALSVGWYYYGLGDLTENEYVIFEAGYMFRQIGIGTLFLLISFGAIAAMALAVSTFSSTMGGAIIIGLILYFFFDALALIPATLGITLRWGGEEHVVPYMTLGFPAQLFVPMYVLDALPTGIAVERWWSGDIQRMTVVCTSFFLLFFAISAIGVRKRDFAL